MKVKTSELQGPALDWAVCRAIDTKYFGAITSPSTDWSQCGPLVEQLGVAISPEQFGWEAAVYDGGHINPVDGQGPAPLIAACRAIVETKLGDEVDVPEGLL